MTKCSIEVKGEHKRHTASPLLTPPRAKTEFELTEKSQRHTRPTPVTSVNFEHESKIVWENNGKTWSRNRRKVDDETLRTLLVDDDTTDEGFGGSLKCVDCLSSVNRKLYLLSLCNNRTTTTVTTTLSE